MRSKSKVIGKGKLGKPDHFIRHFQVERNGRPVLAPQDIEESLDQGAFTALFPAQQGVGPKTMLGNHLFPVIKEPEFFFATYKEVRVTRSFG